MGMWEKVKAFFAGEAADVKDELAKIGEALDDELAKREREQQASPEERVEMILEEIEEEDDAFSALEERIKGTPEEPDAS